MSFEQAVVRLEQTNAALQEEVIRFRDAVMGLSNIYPTITEGRQNTPDGRYFSVPGSGAYMRLYRRSGSSASLIAEFPDRAELNSVIDQLGPLLGRGVVGSSGSILAKGAYGLGANPSYNAPNIEDITQDFESGFYRMRMNSVGAPPGDINFWASLLFTSGQGGRRHAILHEFLGSPGSKLHVGARGSNTGEMIWQYALLNTHMVGAVSQSGGMPTGAIIERGSNANGEYVKFADGTMIVMANVKPNWALAGQQIFPYPHSFSPAGRTYIYGGLIGGKFGTGEATGNFETIRSHGCLDSSVGWYLNLSGGGVNNTSDVNRETVSLIAYGRWY